MPTLVVIIIDAGPLVPPMYMYFSTGKGRIASFQGARLGPWTGPFGGLQPS